MQLEYNTRDGKGNDILKLVQIKEFPIHQIDFECKICGRICTDGRIRPVQTAHAAIRAGCSANLLIINPET